MMISKLLLVLLILKKIEGNKEEKIISEPLDIDEDKTTERFLSLLSEQLRDKLKKYGGMYSDPEEFAREHLNEDEKKEIQEALIIAITPEWTSKVVELQNKNITAKKNEDGFKYVRNVNQDPKVVAEPRKDPSKIKDEL